MYLRHTQIGLNQHLHSGTAAKDQIKTYSKNVWCVISNRAKWLDFTMIKIFQNLKFTLM